MPPTTGMPGSLPPSPSDSAPERKQGPQRIAGERPDPNAPELERELTRFLNVFKVADEQAADGVDPSQSIYGGAIPGMLRVLDPHSVFFDKDQFEQVQEMQRSVSKGFGSVVSIVPGRVIILQTQPGSPSQRAGLAPGDEILGVNNIPLASLDTEQLIQLLGSARQRTAHLYVRRQGTAGILTFTMTPAEMQAASVDRIFQLDDHTGYVRVSSFEPKTGYQLRQAIEKLGGTKLQALVIDLRDNPGGVVEAGLEAAALFLKPGAKLLSARGRSMAEDGAAVPDDAQPYTCKLAVLVNRRTASAAEIAAGALQDNDRATILGEQTYGKGLVQRVYTLSDQTGLALTTAYYYTPSGRSVQKPLHGNELEAATRVQVRPEYKTVAGRTVRGGGGIEPDIAAAPELPSVFGVFLENSGLYMAFATDWLSLHRTEASREMEIAPALLDEFRTFLTERRIQPSISEWTGELTRMRPRLKQEILNQSIGIEAGDEIEIHRDAVVRRALEKLATP